jgi:membrane-bound lytic murein transglycosylase F
MRKVPIFAFLMLIALGGCTPMGEGIARRDSSAEFRRAGESTSVGSVSVESTVSLDASTRATIQKYGPSIRECAKAYGLDWRLVLAVMRQESKFEPDAESYAGASGLMQVMPVTQHEIVEKIDIEDTTHPSSNIRMGAYYLSQLIGMFDGTNGNDRLKLALASYNAGPSRVYDAQELAAYLGDNPGKWQSIKDALPLLSRRYDSLHKHVWLEGRPRAGSFGGARQTVAYVDAVMANYEKYQQALN